MQIYWHKKLFPLTPESFWCQIQKLLYTRFNLLELVIIWIILEKCFFNRNIFNRHMGHLKQNVFSLTSAAWCHHGEFPDVPETWRQDREPAPWYSAKRPPFWVLFLISLRLYVMYTLYSSHAPLLCIHCARDGKNFVMQVYLNHNHSFFNWIIWQGFFNYFPMELSQHSGVFERTEPSTFPSFFCNGFNIFRPRTRARWYFFVPESKGDRCLRWTRRCTRPNTSEEAQPTPMALLGSAGRPWPSLPLLLS